MKKEKLEDILRYYGVEKPRSGTGIGRRVTNQDLEDVLGDYFFEKKFPEDSEDRRHMAMRRMIRPMKAFRFNELNEKQQISLLEDNNGWIAERKYDGWRIIATHFPGERLHFFGGNLSTNEFMPVDYTYHMPEVYLDIYEACMLDAEAVCYDMVIQQDGYPSNNTREAITAILGSNAEAALEIQQDALITIHIFDLIFPYKNISLSQRKRFLHLLDLPDTAPQLSIAEHHATNKRRLLNNVWTEGGEGLIVKNLSADYDSGGRRRTHAIKIKKSASSLIGDTIDAFVSGYVLTEIHSQNNLIGGLELSVYVDDDPVVIANITSLPDRLRHALTVMQGGMPALVEEAYGKVLEIDGQEFSSRNRKLMHAKAVSWDFRKDKTDTDCTMESLDFGGKF